MSDISRPYTLLTTVSMQYLFPFFGGYLFVSLALKFISYREHVVGSCFFFLIHSATLLFNL